MTIAEGPRPPRQIGSRTGGWSAQRPPAQIISLVIGCWWTLNGIGALFIDSNLATDSVHGAGNAFGPVTITVNGWHAVFHLLSGLLGLAVASRPRAALAYVLGVGTVYIVAGTWGLLAGGSSLGVIAVDSPGDVVHISEGVIALTAGVLTLRHRRAVAEGIQAS